MTHKLRKGDPRGVFLNPLIVTLRYRCECANNEVLSISVVLDPKTVSEEQFIFTMKQLWEDVNFEVAQHLGVNDGKTK